MKFTLSLLLLLFLVSACKNNEKKPTAQLNTSPSQYNDAQDATLKESMERGGIVYTDFCMQCHIANGTGIPGSFPPLANSNWLRDKRTESIRSVKYGQQGEIEVNGTTYNGVMAPMGLSDEEVADVMNYIMNNWGNSQDKMVTPEEVAAVKK